MLVSTARTLRRLLHCHPAMHLVYRNPRTLVIEDRSPFLEGARMPTNLVGVEPDPEPIRASCP